MKGWKTIAFGALITALGSIQAVHLADIVPAPYVGIVMSGIGIAIMILRTVTNTPVTKSE